MKRIIVADDHSYIRLGLIQILKDEFPFAEIKEIANGTDLINAVKSEDWDLIISDLEMPGKNGLEALEQIKEIKPGIPVLMLSIYDEELYAIRALKAGASGYLNKNSIPEELINVIRHIQSGRKYINHETAEMLLKLKEKKMPHETLSNREFSIFILLAQGKSVSQIADQLSIATTTVSTHRSRILEKLHFTNNADLTKYAIQHHLITGIS
ncbi:MAG: response regulator transcription factor [Chitinophagaceae bacterium]|nr:response regulator transcription factor [Chitinophagaceae bacterium]